MSAILDNEKLHKGLRLAVEAVKSVWGWSRDRLWPIYSAAILLSVFEMIASSAEKQTLADHYCGDVDRNDGKLFNESRSDLMAESKKYFHEEVGLAIKERVWNMSPGMFHRTYKERLGDK